MATKHREEFENVIKLKLHFIYYVLSLIIKLISYLCKMGLGMNGTHQVLANADDVNLIGDDIRTIERSANVLLNACKDIDLAVNTGKYVIQP